MEVTVNIPNELFQELIEDCEKKSGQKFNNLKEAIKKIKSYKLDNVPDNDQDRKLYMWLAALTWDDIIISVINKSNKL